MESGFFSPGQLKEMLDGWQKGSVSLCVLHLFYQYLINILHDGDIESPWKNESALQFQIMRKEPPPHKKKRKEKGINRNRNSTSKNIWNNNIDYFLEF